MISTEKGKDTTQRVKLLCHLWFQDQCYFMSERIAMVQLLGICDDDTTNKRRGESANSVFPYGTLPTYLLISTSVCLWLSGSD